MGTSQSSGGPGAGIAMIPSWVPLLPAGAQPPGAEVTPSGPQSTSISPTPPSASPPLSEPTQPASPKPAVPIAPSGRFNSARRNLGAFAKGGDTRHLKRSLRNFVRQGYGGASTTTRRMGGTVAGGAALYDALTSLGGAGAPSLDPAVLRGQSAKDVVNAIIEAAHPVDGTLDAEGRRSSSGEALAELLTQHPNADLFNLTEEHKFTVVETFVANDVYHRIDLDVGRTLRDKAPSVATAMSRLNEMRNYVREVVAASFRKLKSAGQVLTRQSMSRIISSAINETFAVFEGFLK